VTLNPGNRSLLRELVRTDFKLRYQGSVLGYSWSLLRPLLLFAILELVFVKFLRLSNGVPHYAVYLLLGIVLWSFFSETTVLGMVAIVNRGELVRKVRVPHWLLVFSASLGSVINLVLSLSVVAVFMIFNHVPVLLTIGWMPLILLELYIFALGTALILATLYVRFRDVSYMWEVALQGAFYATPIIYPVSLISKHSYEVLIMVNPLAQTIQQARYATVTHATPTLSGVTGSAWALLLPVVVVVLVFTTGVVFFRRHSPYFAENL
jgi:ABC-2 type transport system permease protein